MFSAIVIDKTDEGQTVSLQQVDESRLPEGDVTIDVAYSTLNFKDGLAITGSSPVVRKFPMVPGIDLAGTVTESSHADWKAGDTVVLNGWGVGEVHWGGLAQKARLNGDWLVPLPGAFTPAQAMAIGTAGYTSALCVDALVDWGIKPDMGPILVTGATGGVGSLAVDIFSRAGYAVHAISGKPAHAGYLGSIGASEVLGREALATTRPLESVRFGGGLDNVGGPMLASLLAQTRPYGNVASAGLAASAELATTVMPHIIRGVSLLGVASAGTARDIREEVWQRLASEWKPRHLDRICTRETTLEGLSEVFEDMLAGGSVGRTLVTFP